MAGMEQLEIHSKSYLVRWINVSAGHSISWSIQPHKKSLNFGIFKHPGGTTPALTPHSPSSTIFEGPQTPAVEQGPSKKAGAGASKNDSSRVVEKLQTLGYKSVAWTGKCEADKVMLGRYDVPTGEGGMYGLVFDNTFSKTVSKTATLVLLTHPTNAPPKSGHSLHFSQAFSTASSSKADSPSLAPLSGSVESLPKEEGHRSLLHPSRPKSSHASTGTDSSSAAFHTGILQKKRRKRNQGYARRFFSLDFTSATLSYYKNNHSSALRGSIPLSLAEIGVDEKRREISVDSGAEVWRLKASNKKDFEGWRDALVRASNAASLSSSSDPRLLSPLVGSAIVSDPADDRDWLGVENLVGRVSGIRDAVRRLAQDTDPKYQPAIAGLGISKVSQSPTASPPEVIEPNDYFGQDAVEKPEKPSFWKRKTSSNNQSPAALMRRSVSAQLAVPSPNAIPQSPRNNRIEPKQTQRGASVSSADEGVHSHCMQILQDLDAVVAEFSILTADRRQRKIANAPVLNSRTSMDSIGSSDEFFDAEDAEPGRSTSGFLTIRRDSENDAHSEIISDAGSASSDDEAGFDRTPRPGQEPLFPSKPKSLTPLPLERVRRRTTVPPAKVMPPSLIAFLRKNVGKDLSTIAMPVSANEPTSLLQRFAEQLEYSELLDAAAEAPDETGERILHIAAFAISSFSNSRVKERAIRKPFNPMLGETYELVREDKGFRLISEKVTHRPVRIASQADAQNWTFVQSAVPVQKFWGKSAELNTDGRAHVIFHNTSKDHFSWTTATSFLRNIIAGEKYVEPTGTMTIINETTGDKAVCTFKAGGMFAGRSEDVNVAAFDREGTQLPVGLTGKWTSHLNLTDTGKTIWQVGPLVDNAPQRYGFTSFAASLNDITPIEDNHLPPTDSRLRPDQRFAEEGELDRAEALKARLEERQRARRRVMEEHGDEWTPQWFVKATGDEQAEEVWRLKVGKEGYWESREKGDWKGVVDVFQH